MRRALMILALAMLPVAAHSAAPPAKKADAKSDVGQYVDLQPIGLPIVSEGRLVNYVFVYIRLNLSSRANALRLREKEPYFRDALVRAGHRTPFNSPNDLQSVDAARLKAAMMRDAAAIAGAGAVQSVTIVSQAPRAHVRAPRPAA